MWLDDDIIGAVHVPGHKFIGVNRSARSGGVGMFFKNKNMITNVEGIRTSFCFNKTK